MRLLHSYRCKVQLKGLLWLNFFSTQSLTHVQGQIPCSMYLIAFLTVDLTSIQRKHWLQKCRSTVSPFAFYSLSCGNTPTPTQTLAGTLSRGYCWPDLGRFSYWNKEAERSIILCERGWWAIVFICDPECPTGACHWTGIIPPASLPFTQIVYCVSEGNQPLPLWKEEKKPSDRMNKTPWQ